MRFSRLRFFIRSFSYFWEHARHELGLRISSNPVEKANDIVVAQRQKHNGMSWSETGSGALAQISALFHNDGLALWLDENRLSIFPAHSA